MNISAGYHCQSCIILFHRRFLSTDHIHSVQLLTQSGYDNSAAQSNSQTAASKLYHELLSQAPANLQQTAASQAYQAPTFTSSTTTTSSNTQSSRHAHHNSSAQAAATLTSNLFPSTANSKEFSGTRLLLCTNEQAFLYDISNGTTLADYSFGGWRACNRTCYSHQMLQRLTHDCCAFVLWHCVFTCALQRVIWCRSVPALISCLHSPQQPSRFTHCGTHLICSTIVTSLHCYGRNQ